jgi:2-polyprenyl-3-methyl-5-hydroxy-6-metoxy-1,4-benzoquinol methylase
MLNSLECNKMEANQTWKSRLYNAYVSSGQAGADKRHTTAMLASRAPYIKSVIAKHMPPERDASILDIGCGYGAFLFYLNEAGYRNCSGVDVSTEQVNLARELGLKNVERKELISALIDTADSSADVVLAMDILEHLNREELFAVLDEIFRVLKPGGRCLAHVPNGEGLFGMRIRYGDLTHESAFTPMSARQCFQTIGFHTVACHEDRPVIHGWRSCVRRLLWDLGTLPSRLLLMAETGQRQFVLSQNMLVIAVK